MTEKTPNYTPEMVARLHEVYTPDADEKTRDAQIGQLAEEFGKNRKSVIAKLVRESLYVKKEYKTKKGSKPENKETIVASMAELLGVDADTTLSGLEKATKNCLLFLRKTLQIAGEEIAARNTENDS